MNKNIVVQQNVLIKGKYKLGVTEMKIILHFISLVNRDDSDFWTYTIPASDLNMDYKLIKSAARNLMSKPAMEIPQVDKDWLFVHWFSDISYNNGCIEASFSPKLKPYLLELKKQFTTYELSNILPLNSIYAIRIYQLLKSDLYKGTVIKYTINDLREMFGLVNKYNQYSSFKSRVLETARSELLEHTDISFTYNELKTGRRVTSIEFHVTVKSSIPKMAVSKDISLEELNITSNIVNDLLVDCGIAQKLDEDLNQRFELKLDDVLIAFKKWAITNNKQYPDWVNSFKKYVIDGFTNGYWVL